MGRSRRTAGEKNGGVMSRRGWIASVLLLVTVVGTAGCLAAWKYVSMREADAASARQPEAVESVTGAVATEIAHQPMTTSIGTIIAVRSVTPRNELPGTFGRVTRMPGQIVAAGTVLVTLA